MQLNTPIIEQPTADTETSEVRPTPSNAAIQSESEISPPFSSYESVKKQKYSIEFFQLPDVFANQFPTPKDELIKRDVNTIEEYIANRILNDGLVDSVETYHEIVSHILSEITDLENELPDKKVSRIAYYIQYLNKIREADSIKPFYAAK